MANEKRIALLLLPILSILTLAAPALAKDVAQATPPPRVEPPVIEGAPPAAAPAAGTGRSIGGHVGVASPLVTVAKTTTTVSDQFTVLNPIGLSVKISDTLVIDFEFVIVTDVRPAKMTHVIVDPGVIYNWGKFATGLRVAWQIQENANFGLIPLLNVPLVDMGGATWFVEAAFPTFIRHTDPANDNGNLAFNAVLHTGVGF